MNFPNDVDNDSYYEESEEEPEEETEQSDADEKFDFLESQGADRE